MNRLQRLVVVSAAVAIALMLVYPPYTHTRRGNMGYSWIFSPPEVSSGIFATVDAVVLVTQWFGVLLISAMGYWLSKDVAQDRLDVLTLDAEKVQALLRRGVCLSRRLLVIGLGLVIVLSTVYIARHLVRSGEARDESHASVGTDGKSSPGSIKDGSIAGEVLANGLDVWSKASVQPSFPRRGTDSRRRLAKEYVARVLFNANREQGKSTWTQVVLDDDFSGLNRTEREDLRQDYFRVALLPHADRHGMAADEAREAFDAVARLIEDGDYYSGDKIDLMCSEDFVDGTISKIDLASRERPWAGYLHLASANGREHAVSFEINADRLPAALTLGAKVEMHYQTCGSAGLRYLYGLRLNR
jgi:hypothetical protein